MMARTELQGRYSATSSSVYTVTSALCRALAGALLGAGLGDVFLGILVGCCVASMFGFAWMARLLSPAIDNVRSVRSNSAL
jgi:hypothetical protein